MRYLSPRTTNPILDPGAPVSFAGIRAAAHFAEETGIEFILKTPETRRRHGFGPGSTQGGETIGVWQCSVYDLHDRPVSFSFDIIEGDSPVLLGLDYDGMADTMSLVQPATWRVRVDEDDYEFGLYIARDAGGNLRRYVEFRPRPQTILTFLSRARRSQGAFQLASLNPLRFAMRLHGWSHFPLEQMRRLAKQAGLLTPPVDQALQKVAVRCESCPLTGSNIGSAGLRRVSLTKHLHPEGNRMLEIDHVSHVLSMLPVVRERLCLSLACKSTGYGETPPVTSKSLPVAIAAIESTWILRHGAPEAIAGDPGLGGKVMTAFCEQHGIQWEARPPRRHNTIGVVERRNGVMRQVLERLVAGNDSLPAQNRVSDGLLLGRANFLGNIILGDATLSSFQLLKGYQPSLVGLPTSTLSPTNIETHLQLTTSRALSRMLRAKNFNPYLQGSPLRVGQLINVHTQRHTGSSRGAIGWAKHRVCRVDKDMVASLPVHRTKGKLSLTSFADVRIPPQDPIAQSAFDFALQQPLSSLGRCGDTAETDPTASDPTADEPTTDTAVDAASQPVALENARLPESEAQESVENAQQATHAADVSSFYSRMEASALTRDADDVGDVAKDIGTLDLSEPEDAELRGPDVQKVCQDILDTVGRENVTRAKLAFVAPWILDQALEDELTGWDKHISVEPLRAGVSKRTVIGSHVLYCVKTKEDGSHHVKARLVIHGNEERDKERLRCDASSLHFTLIRVILSVAACFGFVLGGVDVSKAYHQSGGPPREIRIRPPAECMLYRMVWLLLSLPYGLVDAGRQWQLAMEVWLIDTLGFVAFAGLPQVFAKLDKGGALLLLIGKISDDILVAGRRPDVLAFFEALHDRWEISKSIIADDLLFNGARIFRDPNSGDISLDMTEYLESRVEFVPLTRERRKEQGEKATAEEALAYRSIAGSLNFLGVGALPEASFVASVFLQRQANLLVHDLDVGNKLIGELKKLKPIVKFVAPPTDADSVTLLGFSDASFNIIGGTCYGQSGFVCGLLFRKGNLLIFHVYDWYSNKQRRIVYSSFGAEILACADADNRLFGLRMGMSALLGSDVESELLVDSKGLFTCITTLSDQREYRLRRTIARIRESFDSEELNRMRWISGRLNLADAPTKWNPEAWALLQSVLNAGILPGEIVHGDVRGDSPAWRKNLPRSLLLS